MPQDEIVDVTFPILSRGTMGCIWYAEKRGGRGESWLEIVKSTKANRPHMATNLSIDKKEKIEAYLYKYKCHYLMQQVMALLHLYNRGIVIVFVPTGNSPIIYMETII